ncbi:MAG: PEP-CTERM sorting domain-containing protein [Kiritimatiellae bacterium]|nr:PEP-CTERM sorting domain-containing protein [Kiritimatiellia bacterium]
MQEHWHFNAKVFPNLCIRLQMKYDASTHTKHMFFYHRYAQGDIMTTHFPFIPRTRLTLLLAATALGSTVFAASQTWQNIDNDWGDGANWGGSIPGAVGSTSNTDIATFPEFTTPVNPNLGANHTIGALDIDNSDGNYNFTGSATLRVNGATVGLDSNVRFRIVGGGTSSVAPGLNLQGNDNAQILVFNLLDVANNAATLNLNGVVSMGNGGNRSLSLNGGALNFNGGIQVLAHATTTTRTLTLEGAGEIMIASYGVSSGAGPVPITLGSDFAGTLNLHGNANVFNTTTAVNLLGGTLVLHDDALNGNGMSWTGNSGTVLRAGTGGSTIHGTVTYNRTGVSTADLGLMGTIGGDQDITFTGDFLANHNAGNSNRQIVTISNTGLTSFNNFRWGGGNTSVRAIGIDTASAEVTAEITGSLDKFTTGTGNFSKLGEGTLILSGTASHTGITDIEAGIFLVNGEMSTGGGTVTVFAGAALGGNGTISRNIVFDAGANLYFDGVSTLIADGANISFGGFSIDNVLVDDWSALSNGTYVLINGTSSFGTYANIDFETQKVLGDGRIASLQQGSLEMMIIPEPGTLVLLGIALGTLVMFRRRK